MLDKHVLAVIIASFIKMLWKNSLQNSLKLLKNSMEKTLKKAQIIPELLIKDIAKD